MKFKHLLICLLLMMGVSMNAQDIHFSQFYLSPLNLNPAMTGVMNCNIRLVANYRNQWASVLKSNAYSTYSASYDQKIAVGRYDYFGVGASFWGDVAGEANFATTTGRLTGSYAKRMGGGRKEAHYLVVGAEAGLSQRSIDFDKLRWGTQHDGSGGHNPDALSLEDNLFNDQFLFADLGAGLLWFSVFDENNNLYIGGAYHHLNRANQTFYEENGLREDLYSRFTIHAGGEFAVASRLGLLPGVIVMKQGPSFQVNSGTSLRFRLGGSSTGNFGNYQAFQVGAWVRVSNRVDNGYLTDAAIISTRFDYNQFSIGFSYDLNVSALQPASNNNGAFEFALLYKFCGNERRGVYCPNF
ncbi:MAG: PorP/SprF family type IX secretion system membrane protein [Bacteroidota bacterium]